MKKASLFRLLILSTAVLAGIAFGRWEPLDPVGDGEVVGPGGCAARGRGYTFVAIGDGSRKVYAFDHEGEMWDEIEVPMPEAIDYAGAMAYELGYGRHLYVVTDESGGKLQVYRFYENEDLEGEWLPPIPLPESIGPGVALAFVPCVRAGTTHIGDLYLLVGKCTRHFYRRSFDWIAELDALGPGNDAEITVQDICLDWLPDPWWDSYRLQVSSNADFTSLVLDTVISVGEFKPAGAVFPSATGTYYWRVRGIKDGHHSDWSEAQSFTLAQQNTSLNYEIIPADGLLISGDELVFDWQPQGDAESYRLQVALSPDFSEPVIDVITDLSEWVAEQPLETGTYYWRVCCRRANGWDSWTQPIEFQVEYGWQRLPDIPSDTPVGAGGAMCYVKARDGDTMALYVLVGNGSSQFWRFNLSEGGVWQERAETPYPQTGGAAITSYQRWWQSSDLWAIFGDLVEFRRTFKINDNSWTRIDYPLPRVCEYGSSIVRNEPDYHLVLVVAGEYPEDSTNFYAWVPDTAKDGEEGAQARSAGFGPADVRFGRDGSDLWLNYTLSEPAAVDIGLFNPAGQKVASLYSGWQSAGCHQHRYRPGSLINGVCFIRVDIAGRSTTIKLTAW
ncbi:MAG: hypothetical protein ABIK54_06825 [candidate division WOR-3 bacterium]